MLVYEPSGLMCTSIGNALPLAGVPQPVHFPARLWMSFTAGVGACCAQAYIAPNTTTIRPSNRILFIACISTLLLLRGDRRTGQRPAWVEATVAPRSHGRYTTKVSLPVDFSLTGGKGRLPSGGDQFVEHELPGQERHRDGRAGAAETLVLGVDHDSHRW